MSFAPLQVNEQLCSRLAEIGIVQPTPIQEAVIPAILTGDDVIGQAQTGSGKTFAFLIPMIQRFFESDTVQALVVAPTRELARQIADEAERLLAGTEHELLAVYGGQDVERQIRKLEKAPALVVGTPGRLCDHLRRETLDLSGLRCLVLDEADQMLHIGFRNELDFIIDQTNSFRQMLLFSATFADDVRNLAEKYMNKPQFMRIGTERDTVDTIYHRYIELTDRWKYATVKHLIQEHRPYLAIVFCRTRRRVEKVFDDLVNDGYLCDQIHGDLSQAQREKAMAKFRRADIQILVATDVAARGLDVDGVTHVFNFDIPRDVDSYVHRIGRTGRAGQSGMAITFVAQNDVPFWKEITAELDVDFRKMEVDALPIPSWREPKPARERDERNLGQRRREEGVGRRLERDGETRPRREERGGSRRGEERGPRREERGSSRRGEERGPRREERGSSRRGEERGPRREERGSSRRGEERGPRRDRNRPIGDPINDARKKDYSGVKGKSLIDRKAQKNAKKRGNR